MTTSERRERVGQRTAARVRLGCCVLAITLSCLVVGELRAQESTPPEDAAASPPPADAAAPAESKDTSAAAVPEASPPEPAPAPAPPPPPPPAAPMDEKPVYDRPKNDATSLNASAGASINTGNTRSYQLTAGGDLRVVRNPHGVGASVAFAYGRADAKDDMSDRMLETIKNLNAKARYDFFITQADAVFLATAFRWDPFAGIGRRNQGSLGYLRYFVVEEKHRFWAEVGYDLTSDHYIALPMKDAPDPLDKVYHSARVFLGYDNQLNEAVTYLGGLEALLDVERLKHVRVNFDNALRSSLGGDFKLEVKVRIAADGTARSDRGAAPIDTATVISLLYTLI